MQVKRAYTIAFSVILSLSGCGPSESPKFTGGENVLYSVENIKIVKENITTRGGVSLLYTLHLYCKIVSLANKELDLGPYVLRLKFNAKDAKSFLKDIQGKFIKIPFIEGLSWGGTEEPGDGKIYFVVNDNKPDLLRMVELTSMRSVHGENKEELMIKAPTHFKTLEELTKFVDDAQIYSSKGEGR